jgi:Ca-activated chloride channel family protein
MIFKDWWFFSLLLVIPIALYLRGKNRPSSLRFSSLTVVRAIASSWLIRFRRSSLTSLYFLAASCFILALARPQAVSAEKEYETEGIDIMIALDISGSMQAMDFQPENRLAVAKEEGKRFIRGREHDRIGLVIFARQSYTQCPLTLDYDVLSRLLDEVELGLIKDGTAIGLGIANAVNRLRNSEAKSKVIILLTDGANNAGNIDPITAAQLAKTFKIKIYAIGVGKEGLVPFPVDDPLFGRRYVQAQVEMDESVLQKIAAITGGIYFRARDEKSLSEIYRKIDSLEKSKVKVKEYTSREELFPWFLIPGIIAVLGYLLIENVLLVKIP